MVFPKPVMKTSELVKMGFPKKRLMQIANQKGQKVVFRLADSGCFYWDTDKLKRLLEQKAVR